MNGNNVCARVFRKRLATMCVFSNAWCKMHGWTNSDAEGTGASTTGKRSPPGDCGESRSVWSRDRQDVLRMHGRWFQKKQHRESQNRIRNYNQTWLTPNGHRRRRRRCKSRPDIEDQRHQKPRANPRSNTGRD